MNKGFITASTLAVIAIGFDAYFLYHYRESQNVVTALKGERDALRTERDAAQREAARADQRVAETTQKNSSLQRGLDTIFSSKTDPLTSTTASRIADPRLAQRWREAEEGRLPLQITRNRLTVERALETTYQALYRQLNFSSDQIAQFKALTIDQAKRFEELDKLAAAQLMRPTDPAIQPRYAQAEEEFKNKAASAFGTDALPVIKHFSETLFLRAAVPQVAHELFYTTTPLTAHQADELVEVMWRNLLDSEGRPNLQLANTESMREEARKILAPPQFTVWCDYIDFLSKTVFTTGKPPGSRK